MRIRLSTAQDSLDVEALLGRSYPALMAGAYEDRVLALALPFVIRARPELLTSGTFYVAEDAGGIAGCGGWNFGEPASGTITEGLVHLRHFAVDPARARQGIGRRLFAHCVRTAAQEGAARCQAFASLNAQSFYESMGLTRMAIIRIPMGPDAVFPAVVMEGAVAGAR